MAKILYEAQDNRGETQRGYVDAASLDEARTALAAQGLTEPKFFSDPAVSVFREDLAKLAPEDAAWQAGFELRLRKNPGYSGFLRELLRRQWLTLSIAALVLVYGVVRHSPLMWLAALVFLAQAFGIPLWKYRRVMWHQGMLRAYAIGDWDGVAQLCTQLAQGSDKTVLLEGELAIRSAYVRIRTGQSTLAQEEAALEPTRAKKDAVSPGVFDARLSSLHLAAGDYEGAIACMQKASDARPDDPSRMIDLALVHARFGDLDKAEELLAKVADASLQVMAVPFLKWARGMVALRRGEADKAETELAQAMREFMQYGNSAVVLGAVGLCGSAYAVALARNGRAARAQDVIDKVLPVFHAHGDPALHTMIKGEVEAGRMQAVSEGAAAK